MRQHTIISALALIFLCLGSCASPSKPEVIKYKGKSYQLATPEHGKMSWYSVKTNFGTATASGEKFTNHGHTAAHRKHPMGSLVRVTNLANNKSIVLKVNDRGPYKKGRIIDVAVGMSHAKHLNFHRDGVVPCKVELLVPVN